MNKPLTSLLMILLLAFVSACTSLPPAPAKASVEKYDYLIGPGDQLSVVVWQNADVSAQVEVRPDGKISSPLIGEIVAASLSPEQLASEIQKRLSRFLRDPKVSVSVTGFVGNPTSQIRVIGQALRPAAIPFKRGITLLDVMIEVGGVTEFASPNRAVLIRTFEDGKEYALRIGDLIRGVDVSANVELLPGDIIMIPEGIL